MTAGMSKEAGVVRKWMLMVHLAAVAASPLIASAAPAGSSEPTGSTPVAQSIAPAAAEVSPKAASGLLLDIAYNGMRLVAVGERGNIVVSERGRDWTQAKVPVRSTLTALSFADSLHGWAVGHDCAILKTSDGGQTWELQHFAPEAGKVLLDVAFLDANRGLAVGTFGVAMSTSDGGKTWQDLGDAALQGDGLHLNAIIRLGDGSLLVAGESGALFLSRDGKAWERVPSPYTGTLFGAVRRGATGALIFGLRGHAYVTTDVRSGAWTRLDLQSAQTVFGGVTSGNGDSIIVGADGLTRLVKANDGVYAPPGAGAISTTLSAAISTPYGVFAVGEKGISPFMPVAFARLPEEKE